MNLKNNYIKKKDRSNNISSLSNTTRTIFFWKYNYKSSLGDDGEIYDEKSLNTQFSDHSNKIWSNQQHDYIINPKNVGNPFKKLKKNPKKINYARIS